MIVLDDLSTGSAERLAELVAGAGGVEFVHGSVLDAELVDSLVRRADIVFHLAAAVGVKLIVDSPLDSLRTNIRGTENVLDSAYRHGARVLLASTSEIYGKNPADGLGEDADRILGSPQTSRWSYSEAKAIDESIRRRVRPSRPVGGHRPAVQHGRPRPDRPVRHGRPQLRRARRCATSR